MFFRLLLLLPLLLTPCTDMRAQDPVMLLSFQQLASMPDEVRQAALDKRVPAHLKEIHGRPVKVRGFLYKAPHGQLVLAPEPNLKSCCVGCADKLMRQIAVMGLTDSYDTDGTAVTLQGKFSFAPILLDGGTAQQLYILEDALLVQEQRGTPLMFAWGALAMGAAMGAAYYLLRRKL